MRLYCISLWCFLIYLLTSNAAVPPFKYGCPLPELDTPDCMNTSVSRLCESDGDCQRKETCCNTDCNGTKCMEIEEKLGLCPAVSKRKCTKTIQHRCGADSDCIGTRKCCLDKCGTKCKEPAKPPYVQFGCPFPKPNFFLSNCTSKSLKRQCFTNDDCPKNTRCCVSPCGDQTCKKIKLKDNICPPKKAITCWKDKVVACGVDKQCKGKQKCCEIECGGTRCVDPCIHDKTWRATVGSCKNCSCRKLLRNFLWLGDACRMNINNARVHCCKLCRKYRFF